MSPQFPGAPADATGHYTEMQSTMLPLPSSPTAMEGLAPVSRQHAETALQGEQEQGSHFDNAFFDPEDITFDQVPTHVPDSFDWETFDKTYRTPHEQGANVSLERRDLIPTYNASGYGNIHRQVDDQGDESQFSGIFERAVETRNKGQLHAYFWRNTTASPIPPSINSVLEVFPVQHHNNTPRVQHIDEGNAHHGVGGYNAPGYEKKDDMPSYGNASAQHHDVSVKSIDVGSSDIEAHGNTDPACTGGTYDAHHDVETIGSHTSESLNARTPVAQAYVQAVEEPAKKPTPTFAKQSDGGRRKNGNHGQSWSEPVHSDLSGEKDESSETQSTSQRNSGDNTPPSANIESFIDPALTESTRNNVPKSGSANMTSHTAHNAEKAYGTPADSQEAQLAYPSSSQGVPTSMQDQSQEDSNGLAVLNRPMNNQAHQSPTMQQSQHRSSSSAAAPNNVDQSQEHLARNISNGQQQIQTRPVNSMRPAQGKAPQTPLTSVVPAAAPNDYHSSEAPPAFSEQVPSDSAADGSRKLTVVEQLFPPINAIPGLPTSHELMNPEWSRPEIQTTGVQTKFSSFEDAMSALNSPKGPPRDPDLVVLPEQQLMIVNSFLRAMMNLEEVDDKDKTTLVWKKIMRRRPVEIEAACWNVLEKMIHYHRTTPLPPPKEVKKGGNKGRKSKEEKDKEEEDDDEEDEEEKKKNRDPAKTGALLSFPDRAAAIVRIFHTNKSTCKRMLDYHCKYVSEFVDVPLECLLRCRANIIVNEHKGGQIKTGRAVEAAAKTEAGGGKRRTGKATGKATRKAKGKAEAEAEAEPPVGGGSADEAHEVEDAEKAGNDSQEIVAVQDQDTSGQRGPLYASAARGQSSYAQNDQSTYGHNGQSSSAHNGRHSRGYSMQGQDSTGYNRVMSNAEHNQGMTYTGQYQGVTNAGHNQVISNHGHVPGMTYTGQYQGVTIAGHNQGMNNDRHVQGITYTGQYQGVTNTGHIQSMTYNGYNNIGTGVSNTGQIQRTINTGQLPPTNTSGLHPSMNMDMAPMDLTLEASLHSYGSHSEYEQHSISPDFSAAACPTTGVLNSHTSSMDPSLWAANTNCEMPLSPQLPQMATFYQPTLNPTSTVGPNPIVSRSMGLNPGLPPNNQIRGRKRGSAETGADENGTRTKRRR
ncbi:hypothetical protein KXX11_008122 [Aspergillus fumigatus]|nr:hypothetical protein KXX11_008122 [Aspergillus fumigatus]